MKIILNPKFSVENHIVIILLFLSKYGDLVIAPTVSGDKIARVSEINIPEWKVENYKASLKLILEKIDKEKYLQTSQVLRDAA